VAEPFYSGNQTMKVQRGWYPTVLIRYALENGYLMHSEMKFQRIASRHLPADFFKQFATDMYALPDSVASKNLPNMLVGALGVRYTKKTRGALRVDRTEWETSRGSPTSWKSTTSVHRSGSIAVNAMCRSTSPAISLAAGGPVRRTSSMRALTSSVKAQGRSPQRSNPHPVSP